MQPLVRDSLSTTINANNNDQSPSQDTPVDDNRVVRSIPPWVHTENDDDDESSQRQRLLPLPSAIPASHHYLPAPPTQHKAPGRKWDHLRNAEPAMIDQPMQTNQQRWLPYMMSGPHPRGIEGARIVSDAWMDENMTHMNVPWEPSQQDQPSEKPKGFWLLSPARQRKTFRRIRVSRGSFHATAITWTRHSNISQRIILKNPYVPLVFRLLVLTFTLAGLGLGARVYHEANRITRVAGVNCNKRASTYMAIILDSIAVPYICYITWDEYLSKP